mgnify:FL=1
MNTEKGNVSVIVSFIIVIAIICLAIYSIMRELTSENLSNVATTQNTGDMTGDTTTSTSNKKSMEQIAKNGDMLVMNYTGRLTDGTVFDSNVDPKFNHVQPFMFTLGAGQVIKGWDEGLLGMKVGEKKTLTISPEKGYGASGTGPIPPNATLIFDVELVAIK